VSDLDTSLQDEEIRGEMTEEAPKEGDSDGTDSGSDSDGTDSGGDSDGMDSGSDSDGTDSDSDGSDS
jgi:hypothetical protein